MTEKPKPEDQDATERPVQNRSHHRWQASGLWAARPITRSEAGLPDELRDVLRGGTRMRHVRPSPPGSDEERQPPPGGEAAHAPIPESGHQLADDLGELAAGVGEVVDVVLPLTEGLDQPAVPQQRQVMAQGGLADAAQLVAEVRDVAGRLREGEKYAEPRRVGDLLQPLGRRDGGRRAGWAEAS